MSSPEPYQKVIKVFCARCSSIIEADFGAILLAPPSPFDHSCRKINICFKCFRILEDKIHD